MRMRPSTWSPAGSRVRSRASAWNCCAGFVAADPAANHLVAPLGAFTLLNLAAEGASVPCGQPLEAQHSVLHVEPLDRPSLRRALHTLQGCFVDREDGQIDVACSVWLAKDLAPVADFVAAGHDGYSARIANLDFGDPKAADTINQWAADGTHGAIAAALHELNPDTADAADGGDELHCNLGA